jgi:hypothetical protein
MNRDLFNQWIRLIFFGLLQIVIFKQIQFGIPGMSNVKIFIYPVFIMIMPIRISRQMILVFGFLIGLSMDFFYESPGVHAATATFIAYVRSGILEVLEPRGGYNVQSSPTRFHHGASWFFAYSAIFMFVFMFFYYSVDFFTFFFILDILKNSVLGFGLSIIIIWILQFIFNPK